MPAQALYYYGDPNINQGQLIPLVQPALLPTKKSTAQLEFNQHAILDFEKKCILFWCSNILSFKTENNSFEFKFKENINYPLLENMQITTTDKKWKIESHILSKFKSSDLDYDYTPESTKEVCIREHEYCENSFDVDKEGKCLGNMIYECLEYKTEIIPESKKCYLETYFESHYEMTFYNQDQKPVALYIGNTFNSSEVTEVELSRCGARKTYH